MGSRKRTYHMLSIASTVLLALSGCASMRQLGTGWIDGTASSVCSPTDSGGQGGPVAAASVMPSAPAQAAAAHQEPLFASDASAPLDGPGNGPLRVNPENPRYFTDDDGKAIYLTGSHTWTNLQAHAGALTVDYGEFVAFLEAHNHNFFRLWRWDHTCAAYNGIPFAVSPQPWQRTGPGTAIDGRPRFDLTVFDQSFFDRLRAHIIAAGERGMYVSIMLFEGHALQYSEPPWAWGGHPFNPDNNINRLGIDATTVHTLDIPANLEIQEAFVRKVVDTVNDLDNVLYEIANEDGSGTVEWQYHLINYIKAYEQAKPKQHPIGMTYRHNTGNNEELFASPADWISPGTMEYSDPVVNDGSKVIILDTDHIWGIGGDGEWVWKSFMRGYNPIYMDSFQRATFPAPDKTAQRAMGRTLEYAHKLDLGAMEPRPDLASSTYALAKPTKQGAEYLVYIPAGLDQVDVDLSGSRGELVVEWFDPVSEQTQDGGIVAAGSVLTFRVPFGQDAVLHIFAR